MSSYRRRVGPKSKESVLIRNRNTQRHSDEGHVKAKAEIEVTPTPPPRRSWTAESGEEGHGDNFPLEHPRGGERVALQTPWFWTSSPWSCERFHFLGQPQKNNPGAHKHPSSF